VYSGGAPFELLPYAIVRVGASSAFEGDAGPTIECRSGLNLYSPWIEFSKSCGVDHLSPKSTGRIIPHFGLDDVSKHGESGPNKQYAEGGSSQTPVYTELTGATQR
jgi:hypothetical protein